MFIDIYDPISNDGPVQFFINLKLYSLTSLINNLQPWQQNIAFLIR